jgi:hypothetical protein
MLRRIANNLQEDTDYVSLSMALTASPDSADRLKKMHLEIN